jgi:hypothetical protein
MYNSSCDYAQKIQEKNAEILRENGISGKFYTNFLVNANFTNTQFEKVPIPHLLRVNFFSPNYGCT